MNEVWYQIIFHDGSKSSWRKVRSRMDIVPGMSMAIIRLIERKKRAPFKGRKPKCQKKK